MQFKTKGTAWEATLLANFKLALLTMAGPQLVALTGLYQVLHEQDPHFN